MRDLRNADLPPDEADTGPPSARLDYWLTHCAACGKVTCHFRLGPAPVTACPGCMRPVTPVIVAQGPPRGLPPVGSPR